MGKYNIGDIFRKRQVPNIGKLDIGEARSPSYDSSGSYQNYVSRATGAVPFNGRIGRYAAPAQSSLTRGWQGIKRKFQNALSRGPAPASGPAQLPYRPQYPQQTGNNVVSFAEGRVPFSPPQANPERRARNEVQAVIRKAPQRAPNAPVIARAGMNSEPIGGYMRRAALSGNGEMARVSLGMSPAEYYRYAGSYGPGQIRGTPEKNLSDAAGYAMASSVASGFPKIPSMLATPARYASVPYRISSIAARSANPVYSRALKAVSKGLAVAGGIAPTIPTIEDATGIAEKSPGSAYGDNAREAWKTFRTYAPFLNVPSSLVMNVLSDAVGEKAPFFRNMGEKFGDRTNWKRFLSSINGLDPENKKKVLGSLGVMAPLAARSVIGQASDAYGNALGGTDWNAIDSDAEEAVRNASGALERPISGIEDPLTRNALRLLVNHPNVSVPFLRRSLLREFSEQNGNSYIVKSPVREILRPFARGFFDSFRRQAAPEMREIGKENIESAKNMYLGAVGNAIDNTAAVPENVKSRILSYANKKFPSYESIANGYNRLMSGVPDIDIGKNLNAGWSDYKDLMYGRKNPVDEQGRQEAYDGADAGGIPNLRQR